MQLVKARQHAGSCSVSPSATHTQGGGLEKQRFWSWKAVVKMLKHPDPSLGLRKTDRDIYIKTIVVMMHQLARGPCRTHLEPEIGFPLHCCRSVAVLRGYSSGHSLPHETDILS